MQVGAFAPTWGAPAALFSQTRHLWLAGDLLCAEKMRTLRQVLNLVHARQGLLPAYPCITEQAVRVLVPLSSARQRSLCTPEV